MSPTSRGAHAPIRWTGLPQLYSFYRHLAFNLPRATTGGGITLLMGVGAIHLYVLFTTERVPVYLAAYLALVFAAALGSCAGMLTGSKPRIIRAGWALGSLTATAGLAMYLVSRTIGLPALGFYVGKWGYPLGSFMLILAVAFVTLHATLPTGVSIAWPQQRDWRE